MLLKLIQKYLEEKHGHDGWFIQQIYIPTAGPVILEVEDLSTAKVQCYVEDGENGFKKANFSFMTYVNKCND